MVRVHAEVMIRSFKTKTAALATIGALGIGGGAYAATSASKAPTPLTGSITDKASAAAVAKYPGSTLVGIQSRPDGTYAAQVRKTDGTQAVVVLDKDFQVTAAREGGRGFGGPGGFGGGGGGFGHGGPGRGLDTAALAKTLGVAEDKLQAAIDQVRPAAKADRKDELVAAIAKALGASRADVQAVFDDVAKSGAAGRGFGPRGGGSDLIAALAAKTGKSEDDVREALRSARPDKADRFAELAAALAKELGLDANKVQSALEAARAGGRSGARP
jgi:phenylpyruvate tautomerase PptA (4-oxalocrotonate tautomerase family)